MKIQTILKIVFFPIYLPYRFAKYLIKDVYSDIKFLKGVGTGKKKLVSDELAQAFREADKGKLIKDTLKEYKLVYLLMLAAFLAGFFLASQYYQGKCNEFIFETYIEDELLLEEYKIELPFGNLNSSQLQEIKDTRLTEKQNLPYEE